MSRVPFKLHLAILGLISMFFAVMFTAGNARADEADFCVSDELLTSERAPETREFSQISSTKMRALRLAVVASGDFTAGRSDSAVFEQIQEALTQANKYLKSLRIVLELAGVQVFEQGAGDPYAEASSKRDANAMLNIVRADWTGREYPEHDLVVVFGRSAFGSTFGLSYPKTVCLQPRFSFLFVSQGGATEVGELNFGATLAHEIGHSLGISHDGTFYPEGPSLMWPFFSSNVNGFSKTSLSQFEDYELSGGTSCLKELAEDAPVTSGGEAQTLSFLGGPVQERMLREGVLYQESFPVGGNFPGLSYDAKNLPQGATIDKRSGMLSYTPSFSLLSGKKKELVIDVTVSARTYQLETSSIIRLRVLATNQPPQITFPSLFLKEGQFSRQEFFAGDPDAGDKVKLKLLNSKEVSKLPGKPKYKSSSSSFRIDWTPSAGSAGDYPLVVSATDKSGAETRQTVMLHVERSEPLPTLVAPSSVSGQGGSEFGAAFSVEGATKGFSITGLKPGMLLLSQGGKVELRYSPLDSEKGETVQVRLDAASFGGVQSRAISLLVPKSGDVAPVVWPGGTRAVGPLNDTNGDNRDEFAVYNSLSGNWIHTDCDGAFTNAEFGGLVGDEPLLVHRQGIAVRAIYRSVSGQGWWYLDDGSIPVAFGLVRDVPLAADLDGDGNDELIVYRPSTSEFFVRNGSDIKRLTPFPHSTLERALPFAADIDGDGLAELIRFRRTADGQGVFEALLKDGKSLLAVIESGSIRSTMLPVVADVDGDGRADFGVERDGVGIQWFSTASGKIQSSSESIGSESIFSFRRCGGNGASLVVLNAAGYDLSYVTPESAQLRAAYKYSTSAFGSFRQSPGTALTLLRRDPSGESESWLRRTGASSASIYNPVPALFSSQTAVHVNSLFESDLLSYGNGVWFSQKEDGSLSIAQWGVSGDVPVAGDYNGDGITDLAIYRSGDNSWWILFRGKDVMAKVVAWGSKGDVPVPADYDGDGVTDVAVWRPSSGDWFIRFADGKVRNQRLGSSLDVPMPGDYVGEGKAAVAVWSPATGDWSVQSSSERPAVKVNWGFGSDIPVQGDFDGNGTSDLAVYRSALGTWFFRNLDGGGSALQFGLPSDKPLGGQNTLRIF